MRAPRRRIHDEIKHQQREYPAEDSLLGAELHLLVRDALVDNVENLHHLARVDGPGPVQLGILLAGPDELAAGLGRVRYPAAAHVEEEYGPVWTVTGRQAHEWSHYLLVAARQHNDAIWF